MPQLIFELLVAIPRVDVQIGGNIHEKRSMRLQYLSEFGEILRGRLPYEYGMSGYMFPADFFCLLRDFRQRLHELRDT